MSVRKIQNHLKKSIEGYEFAIGLAYEKMEILGFNTKKACNDLSTEIDTYEHIIEVLKTQLIWIKNTITHAKEYKAAIKGKTKS